MDGPSFTPTTASSPGRTSSSPPSFTRPMASPSPKQSTPFGLQPSPLFANTQKPAASIFSTTKPLKQASSSTTPTSPNPSPPSLMRASPPSTKAPSPKPSSRPPQASAAP